MVNYIFNSLLGPFIEGFIGVKRASGYPYNSSTRILHHFDIFATDKFPEETTITREMGTAWI
ncbi:MAG: hypothetical protein U9N81_07000 [Bacillota bacterium]|nr:hypothetical protein [Bacillota bacterium]